VPRALRASIVFFAIAACAHARPVAFPDAKPEPRDDADRDELIDRVRALPAGAARDAARGEVVAAVARRLTDALEEDRPRVAERLLFQLAALWNDDADAVGRGLADRAPLLARARATFARSGSLEPTICALVLLAEAEPALRAERLAELDEVLRFADELATAEHGALAVRAQPIAQLAPTVQALPLRWLVDRYVALVEDRARAVAATFAQTGATVELRRAHHDVAQSARRIAGALARSGRVEEIAAHLDKLGTGLFADRELAIRARIVADQPTVDAYLDLARGLRADSPHAVGDAHAALAVELVAIARFPRDGALYLAAAADAAQLGRIDQPIALYEAALSRDHGDVDQMTVLRLGRLYGERLARLAENGRPAAAVAAFDELVRFVVAADHRHPDPTWGQALAIGEAALGRGLASQGRLADAERALEESLQRAPSLDAYETLATIRFKTGRLASAAHLVQTALAAVGETTLGDRYRRAKLDRLAGDIARANRRGDDAAKLYLDALAQWAALGPDRDLQRAIAGERQLEVARVSWARGEPDRAASFALAAVDVDPESPSLHAGAVELLIVMDRYADAVDVVHHALDTPELGELNKVYACLWIVADARRRGVPRDRQAQDFLASRHGELWYEQLAEAATGRRDLAALRAAATTAPHRAELAFYAAALGLDPAAATPLGARAMYEQVLASGLVTDAEYDLARSYLGR
jgi:tetratricopeptide (TPR) repeat protein